jgi:hypothetical protein
MGACLAKLIDKMPGNERIPKANMKLCNTDSLNKSGSRIL